MKKKIKIFQIQVEEELLNFVNSEILTNIGVDDNIFWEGFSNLINEFNSNYKLKTDICDKISKLSKKDKLSFDEILTLQNDFNLVGPVSKEKLEKVKIMYDTTIKLINK